jgi:hypothetical protein
MGHAAVGGLVEPLGLSGGLAAGSQTARADLDPRACPADINGRPLHVCVPARLRMPL